MMPRWAMPDWTPGTWWRAPSDQRRIAYYRCMCECYGMPAQEALAYVRKHYSEVANIIEDIRTAIEIRP